MIAVIYRNSAIVTCCFNHSHLVDFFYIIHLKWTVFHIISHNCMTISLFCITYTSKIAH